MGGERGGLVRPFMENSIIFFLMRASLLIKRRDLIKSQIHIKDDLGQFLLYYYYSASFSCMFIGRDFKNIC